MNVYSICMSYEDDDDDVSFAYKYITHENQYSKEEFQGICEECLSKCKDKCNYELEKRLIEEYGFKKLKVLCNFDYAEKID